MAKVTITLTDEPENFRAPVTISMTGDKSFNPAAPPETLTPAQNVAMAILDGVLKHSASLTEKLSANTVVH